ncbi:MAG: chemotaxis protein CheW [Betaproteobacteria bacterium]|nr:chemotaxis protein CheW [Betaproteobacteria bacterium]
MARKKLNLREFQERLSAHLASAAEGERVAALLGVQAGNTRWLVDLSDSGEVVPLPSLSTVPLTQPWFVGIVNIRGNLYAVTDFSAFQGKESTVLTPASRLLLVGIRHASNASLLVSRILGLKKVDAFTQLPDDEQAPVWGRQNFVDSEGLQWKKLDVAQLFADPAFMEISA